MPRLIRSLRLAERPYHAAVSADGRRFVACAQSGRCWFFDHNLRQLDDVHVGAGVRWVLLNKHGSVLVVCFQDHIAGFAASDDMAPLFNLPMVGDSSHCAFWSDEQVLCVTSWDLEPKLTAWNLADSRIIDEAVLPDRGGEGYNVVAHPEGEAMALIAYSGQSEEWLFWAHYAGGRLRVFDKPEIEDVAYPCFHPTGREFVSYHERLGLCRMRFPSGELIASIAPEEAFPDNPDDTFAYGVHFFRDDRFLAWQTCLALYQFDLATLRPISAVLTGVAGKEFGADRFYSEASWQLADGRLLTSDCQHNPGFTRRIDTLRLWDVCPNCPVTCRCPTPSVPIRVNYSSDGNRAA